MPPQGKESPSIKIKILGANPAQRLGLGAHPKLGLGANPTSGLRLGANPLGFRVRGRVRVRARAQEIWKY